MIYTSNYKNFKGVNGISISGDGGVQAGFQGNTLKELAPKKDWWQKWRDNIGKIEETDNIIFYINNYYETVLSKLDAAHIFMKIGHGFTLLCYEEPNEFCHRHIVAAWLELFLNMAVKEITIDENNKIKVIKRNKYYPLIKGTLETLIKEDVEMYNFNSIAAAYLYTISLNLDGNPDLCSKFSINGDMYRRLAEIFEKEYNEKQKGDSKTFDC